MRPLDTEVQYIKGVGAERAKSLERLGIRTLYDLVTYLPRAYEDRTAFKAIGELTLGESVCVAATVATPPQLSHIRRGLDLVKLRVVDERDSLVITFFNQSYVRNQLLPGESYVFFGRVGGRIGAPELLNPIFERENGPRQRTGRLVPLYPLTAGLSQFVLSRAIAQGLEACGDLLPDPLPRGVRERENLAQSRFAYENIHFPKDRESLELARRRLIFEEFFLLTCALTRFRQGTVTRAGRRVSPAPLETFQAALPFTLTGAQKTAIAEIFADMAQERPMSRLVQGDVGSGKTAVAAAALWNAAQAGLQGAFMAPTEILAEQHYATLTRLLEPLGVTCLLLTGGMSAKARKKAKALIASGDAQIVIGTHALITADVTYAALGLVVADEQHRFGVQQRAALSAKGQSPHVLVMSATPIPRTLALIVYGDLDVSLLRELPPGRQKVDTFAVAETMRPRIVAFIRRLVGEGRQVFIVCPAVEENAEEPVDSLKNVKAYAKELREETFPELRVGLVHGKLKAKEKNQVMADFAAGELDILVATTVIEVGVDVPNAALMVVENADRFGLSQLHQLRGRVGRGRHKSYCVLFEGAGGEKARERLGVMTRTNDGFTIAEEDLRLRGPGDFFGSRQHGLPDLQIASFADDLNLLQRAQQAAKQIMQEDPTLSTPENAPLHASVERMIEKNVGTLN